ncbi:hypothetical protein [Microbacterium sp. NPDC056234]|uniref:hypothetical protein n=1 Tax=Microbacterium sp. NPDC056234 TaxID=3345757 RepID=UPI0035E210EB
MTDTRTRADAADEVGRGPLSRGAAFVYRMLVLEGLIVLAMLPTLVVVLLLGRDASNVPFFTLALLPLAPALVAGISALGVWQRSPDLSPGRAFVLAYRRDLLPTLIWAVPATVGLSVLTFNLVHLDAVEGGAMIRPVLVVIVVVAVVWCGHMAVLTAGFRFRTRDAARIALAQLLSQWRFSLGILSLVLVAGALVLLVSELALLMFAWAFVALLALLARPVMTDVTERFTR